MTKRHLATMTVWAIGACALTLAIGLPRSLNATDESAGKSVVDKPTLTVNGIRLTVDISSPRVLSLDSPIKFTINATNPGSTAATAMFDAHLYTTSTASMASRTPTTPTDQWKSDEQSITLVPGQSKQIALTTSDINSNGQIVQVRLESSDQSISIFAGSTPPAATVVGPMVPTTQPALVVAPAASATPDAQLEK